MDQHLHERTNCPVCLRIPDWQIDIFTSRDDLCDSHYYWTRHKSDDEFSEYHDGREVAESWGWDFDWEIDREAGLDLGYHEALYEEQLEVEQRYRDPFDERPETERNYARFPDLYLPGCRWCGSMDHFSSDCPDMWLIYHSPFDEHGS